MVAEVARRMAWSPHRLNSYRPQLKYLAAFQLPVRLYQPIRFHSSSIGALHLFNLLLRHPVGHEPLPIQPHKGGHLSSVAWCLQAMHNDWGPGSLSYFGRQAEMVG